MVPALYPVTRTRLPMRLALVLFALVSSPIATRAESGHCNGDPLAPEPTPQAATEDGGEGLALHAAKILTLARDIPAVIDDGVLLIRDGKIEAVGKHGEVEIPEDCEVVELGEQWLLPGLVELHSHICAALPFDINDTVYLTNPGLRASSAIVPHNPLLRRGIAGGVTTALIIPGSGSNMGGSGVLLKIGYEHYEEMEVRNPGSLKLAQAGNPEDWVFGVSRSLMNWNTRNTFRRGIAYAKAWRTFEEQGGAQPRKDVQLEVFRALYEEDAKVSAHTQLGQVVGSTLTMVGQELGLGVFIDHGSLGGHYMAELAEELGVAAILGPRMIATTFDARDFAPAWDRLDTDGKFLGVSAEYQKRGHKAIGFNTDCVDDQAAYGTPPQEELSLQAAMALRYGLTNLDLESLRGLTIVPAETAGLGDRLGTLEAGKDADILVVTGDIADPRTSVESVYTDGELVYDAERDGRRW